MAVAPFLYSMHDFTTALDELLFDICEEIQLSAARHEPAVQRYETFGGRARKRRKSVPTLSERTQAAGGVQVAGLIGPERR
jgi:hypothetical protein